MHQTTFTLMIDSFISTQVRTKRWGDKLHGFLRKKMDLNVSWTLGTNWSPLLRRKGRKPNKIKLLKLWTVCVCVEMCAVCVCFGRLRGLNCRGTKWGGFWKHTRGRYYIDWQKTELRAWTLSRSNDAGAIITDPLWAIWMSHNYFLLRDVSKNGVWNSTASACEYQLKWKSDAYV